MSVGRANENTNQASSSDVFTPKFFTNQSISFNKSVIILENKKNLLEAEIAVLKEKLSCQISLDFHADRSKMRMLIEGETLRLLHEDLIAGLAVDETGKPISPWTRNSVDFMPLDDHLNSLYDSLAAKQIELDTTIETLLKAVSDQSTFNKWLVHADANGGDKNHQFAIGQFYASNADSKDNRKQAFKWFMKAAENGHRKAKEIVAELYQNGTRAEKNTKLAKVWRYLAENDHSKTLNYLYHKHILSDKKKVSLICLKLQRQGTSFRNI